LTELEKEKERLNIKIDKRNKEEEEKRNKKIEEERKIKNLEGIKKEGN